MLVLVHGSVYMWREQKTVWKRTEENYFLSFDTSQSRRKFFKEDDIGYITCDELNDIQ